MVVDGEVAPVGRTTRIFRVRIVRNLVRMAVAAAPERVVPEGVVPGLEEVVLGLEEALGSNGVSWHQSMSLQRTNDNMNEEPVGKE